MAMKPAKKKEGAVLAFASPTISSATDVDSQENSIREKSLSGLLYAERVNSFENAWPYKKKTDPCNVHNAAMAGFTYISSTPLKVRCVVCYKVLSDLKRTSNIWDLHKEINPQCPIVKFGYPAEPDGYTVNQFVQMMQDAVGNKLEDEFRDFDEFTRHALEAIANKNYGEVFQNSFSSTEG